MVEPTTFITWCIVVGVLLIAMTLGGSIIARLPLSAAMLYLGVGYAIGPNGARLIDLQSIRDVALLERLTEVAVLISLFTAGFKLRLPWRDTRWQIPLRLASVSMIVTVAAIAAIGFFLIGLPIGAAVLLGAILAPTDPVLASDVQVANADDRDRLRLGLTGEGGLNDGAAFPFVMLGLGLLGAHELGAWGKNWWLVDVVWATVGGIAIGFVLGALVGRVVLYLRMHKREALEADEFIVFGLIALAYGIALFAHTYGFLAVFSAGLALRGIADAAAPATSDRATRLASADDAAAPVIEPVSLMENVERFNHQLERFAEVAVVLVVGALLATVPFNYDAAWFVPLLFLVIRPLAVAIGLARVRVTRTQKAFMAWFGIRGIGSIYYLMYAINHKIDMDIAQQLIELTLAVVVASIVLHGVSVTPLMSHYERVRQRRRDKSRAA
ncbi:MAG TPA: cation:proton antiporter [Casimicrobiaceae bacterium]|nr:cation:proton antiporter [Casimicrobiaceae bacterium]